MFGTKSIRIESTEAGHWTAHSSVDARFAGLVERLSIAAKREPNAYRRRVILAGFAGYVVIIVMTVALLGIAAACVYAIFLGSGPKYAEGKIALVTLVVVFALLRSMIIAPYQPDGLRIEEKDAPALFASVDHINRSVNGPEIDEIYITDELNASMAQPARFAVFGVRNVLSLGLPLMQALTERELASVIAHEIGHSVGGHGKWAGFVYRVRVRWLQIAERLPSGLTASILRRFFNWYGPWFNAYSFVLARSQEYEADQVAARVTTPSVAGSALTRIEVQANRFSDHWGQIWSQSRTADSPLAMPYTTAKSAFRERLDTDDTLLARAMTMETGLDDTHPSLADRLAALPAPAELPSPIDRSAAEALLGGFAEELAARFDQDWWAEYGDWWRTLNAEAKDEALEYRHLQATVNDGDATLRQHTRLIELAGLIEGEEAAIAARRVALAAKPRASLIRFYLGVALLKAGQDEGVAEIEQAIAEVPSLGSVGYQVIVDHQMSTGVQPKYQRLLERYTAEARTADQESNSIDQSENLEPLRLDPMDRAELASELRRIDGLTEIIVGQRTLKLNGRQIIYVFAYRSGSDAQSILSQVNEVMLDYGDCLGVEKSRHHAWLAKKLEALEGSSLLTVN